MSIATVSSNADRIRKHAVDEYVLPARRSRAQTFSINVGNIHRALRLNNLVPSVCSALVSRKFLEENHLRLVDRTGPQSGKSTTVTYTYEFLDAPPSSAEPDPWARLRGALKDIFAELGGGENYLRKERSQLHGPGGER
jgi:hypothetical protein